jgi:hypothetical protein
MPRGDVKACKRVTFAQVRSVVGELKNGFCPRADAKHLDRMMSKCHGKLPAKLEAMANAALDRYEEKCGTYLDKGRWQLGRGRQGHAS